MAESNTLAATQGNLASLIRLRSVSSDQSRSCSLRAAAAIPIRFNTSTIERPLVRFEITVPCMASPASSRSVGHWQSAARLSIKPAIAATPPVGGRRCTGVPGQQCAVKIAVARCGETMVSRGSTGATAWPGTRNKSSHRPADPRARCRQAWPHSRGDRCEPRVRTSSTRRSRMFSPGRRPPALREACRSHRRPPAGSCLPPG